MLKLFLITNTLLITIIAIITPAIVYNTVIILSLITPSNLKSSVFISISFKDIIPKVLHISFAISSYSFGFLYNTEISIFSGILSMCVITVYPGDEKSSLDNLCIIPTILYVFLVVFSICSVSSTFSVFFSSKSVSSS